MKVVFNLNFHAWTIENRSWSTNKDHKYAARVVWQADDYVYSSENRNDPRRKSESKDFPTYEDAIKWCKEQEKL